MKAISFPQANKVLKAPPSPRREVQALIDKLAAEGADMSEAQAKLDAALPPEREVYDLPVWGGKVEDAERCISFEPQRPPDVHGVDGPPIDGPPTDRILARFPAQRDDLHDIAEEYVIVAIDTPPGIMLWGRVENRWFANPSGREVVRQLLGRARPTLTQEEERTVRNARIAASPGDEILLAIIDRLTGRELSAREAEPEPDRFDTAAAAQEEAERVLEAVAVALPPRRRG
jgi:hypothetical protein